LSAPRASAASDNSWTRLRTGDGRVAAGAMREGLTLITQDRKFGNFLRAIGYSVEGF
jgi:hypothetical protein